MDKAKIAVNLNLKLPHIQSVNIGLDYDFAVEAQLEPFLDLASETEVFIYWIKDDAARFLLETEERWPDPARVEWFGADDSGTELEEKMFQRFPAKPDLGGTHRSKSLLHGI